MQGLNKPELRAPCATCILTAAEYIWLKQHPAEVKNYSAEIQQEFTNTLKHDAAGKQAKRAVKTKRKKYI